MNSTPRLRFSMYDEDDESKWLTSNVTEEARTDELPQTITKEELIKQLANEIFESQVVYLFGSTKEQEMDAALREASAVIEEESNFVLVSEAATPNVLILADKVAELNALSPNRLWYRQQFIESAYDLKRLLRTKKLYDADASEN